jgi:hypothetical protein
MQDLLDADSRRHDGGCRNLRAQVRHRARAHPTTLLTQLVFGSGRRGTPKDQERTRRTSSTTVIPRASRGEPHGVPRDHRSIRHHQRARRSLRQYPIRADTESHQPHHSRKDMKRLPHSIRPSGRFRPRAIRAGLKLAVVSCPTSPGTALNGAVFRTVARAWRRVEFAPKGFLPTSPIPRASPSPTA